MANKQVRFLVAYRGIHTDRMFFNKGATAYLDGEAVAELVKEGYAEEITNETENTVEAERRAAGVVNATTADGVNVPIVPDAAALAKGDYTGVTMSKAALKEASKGAENPDHALPADTLGNTTETDKTIPVTAKPKK